MKKIFLEPKVEFIRLTDVVLNGVGGAGGGGFGGDLSFGDLPEDW